MEGLLKPTLTEGADPGRVTFDLGGPSWLEPTFGLAQTIRLDQSDFLVGNVGLGNWTNSASTAHLQWKLVM